jgi:hypothetical protein
METDFLAQLIDSRHEVLVQIRELARQQAVLVQDGNMTRLMSLLAVKQRLLNTLQECEQKLEPFRAQDPDLRVWRSTAERQRCKQVAERSETLLAEILYVERQCESELVQRRDQTAELLQGAHSAARASHAYHAPLELRGGQLDVSCET